MGFLYLETPVFQNALLLLNYTVEPKKQKQNAASMTTTCASAIHTAVQYVPEMSNPLLPESHLQNLMPLFHPPWYQRCGMTCP